MPLQVAPVLHGRGKQAAVAGKLSRLVYSCCMNPCGERKTFASQAVFQHTTCVV